MAKFSECALTLAVHCAATSGIGLDDVNSVQEKWNISPQPWICVCVCVCVCLEGVKEGSGWYSAVTNGNTQRRVLLNC